MGKKLFSGDLHSLPNNLRCRRSDGKKWRCLQPVKSGLSYCEYHYHQLQRNQYSKKNTDLNPEASAKPKRRLLLTADLPLAKKRRRKRLRDRPVVEPIGSKKMKKGVVERESSEEKVNMDLPSPVLQPRQSDVRKCRYPPPTIPGLSSKLCSPRRKQPNEVDTVAIERNLDPKPRRSVNLMPWIMQRHWQQPKKSLEVEPIRIGPREDGVSDKMAAEPAVTKDLSIPDPPQCRRSDGRKWRCPQPVMLGIDLCEYHLMRCKQTYNTNPKVKIAKPDIGSNLTTRVLIRTEQNEEALEASKPASLGLIFCDQDRLCCKKHKTRKPAEPAMLSMQATEPATSGMELAEPATSDVEAAEPVTPDLVSDSDFLFLEEDDNKIKDASTKPSCWLYLPSDPQPSKKDLSLSDHLRCRRSDGRKWRCPQLAMPSICFCEYHFLQMRHNQGKRKNPKLASTTKTKRGPMGRKLRQQRVRGELSGVLPTKIGKKKGGERLDAATLVEVTKDLPNGVMAISPGTAWDQANESSSVVRKLGCHDGYLLGRLFRSKNAERVPLSKVQKLPFFRSREGLRKRACHRCRIRENKVAGRILCLNCQEFFCTTCIETWHSELSEFEVNESCPVCRGCCSCINCNLRRDEDGGSKVASCRDLSHFE